MKENWKQNSNIKLPKLDALQSESLDVPITQEEVKAAITSMKPGKSPGADGLRIRILQKVCRHIGSNFNRSLYKGVWSWSVTWYFYGSIDNSDT